MAIESRASTGWKRAVHVSYLLSFLGDVSVGLVSFAISLYTDILTTAAGMSAAEKSFWVGIVSMGYGVTYCWAPFLLGRLSDRIGRKKAIIIGMTGFALVNLFTILFATHPFHLFLSYAACAFFFAFFFPVLGAFMSETSEPLGQATHARVLSRFMIAWSIGLASGPLLGGIYSAIFNYLVAFAFLMCLAGVIACVAYFYILGPADLARLLEKERSARATERPEMKPMIQGKSRRNVVFTKLAVFILPLVFAFDNQIMFTIFPAYGVQYLSTTTSLFFPGFDLALVTGIITFGLGIGRTATFYHTGRLEPATKLKFMLGAPAGMAVAMFIIFAVPNPDVLLFACAAYGAFSGYTFAIGMILTMELTSTEKGTKAGAYEAAVGIGILFSGLLSSIVGVFNSALPFLLAFVVAAITSAILLASFAWQKHESGTR
nr:MFS transporter [Candidatus Sigynarchaeota archaeon]